MGIILLLSLGVIGLILLILGVSNFEKCSYSFELIVIGIIMAVIGFIASGNYSVYNNKDLLVLNKQELITRNIVYYDIVNGAFILKDLSVEQIKQ